MRKAAEAANKDEGRNYDLDLMDLSARRPDVVATVVGKQIYVLATNDAFVESLTILSTDKRVHATDKSVVPNEDVFLFRGSSMRYERDHRDNKADEVTAYSNQIDFVVRMNTNKHFKNQQYFKDIKAGLERLKSEY